MSRKDTERFVRFLYEAWNEGKQVFIAGNGGSSSTATHFAADLNKFTSVEGRKRFRAIALTDNMPTVTAITNDLGWENLYLEQLKNFMHEGDTLVVISVHGGSGKDQAGLWSQNLLKAAKYVQDNDGTVLSLAGFDGGALRQIADASIVVPANSTPQVEGFHAVLTHLICATLRELIAEAPVSHEVRIGPFGNKKILSHILEATGRGAIKTRIMHEANLSRRELAKYLTILMENDLIEEVVNSGGRGRHYQLTEKGTDFLKEYGEIGFPVSKQRVRQESRGMR